MEKKLKKKKRESGRSTFMLLLKVLSALALVLAVIAGFIVCETEKPAIAVLDEVANLGMKAEFRCTVADAKSGIREVEVVLVQGDKKANLYSKTFPRAGYLFHAGPARLEEKVAVDGKALGFTDGNLELVITARDFSFWNLMRGNETRLTTAVLLDTQAPVVSVMESPTIIKPGGAGVVVYRLGEEVARHGVMINGFFHPGFPLPKKGSGVFAAFIALPFDLERVDEAVVLAEDRAGNQGRVGVGLPLQPVKFRMDRRIDIPDSFLNLKLPEFRAHYPEMTGTPVEQYVYVNGEIRKKNYEQILAVCNKPSAERLWEGRFLRMERGSPEAGYADHRTYFYQGKEIDRQVHLGIDLASTQHSEVAAANRGRVAFVDYLGIYGNTVIIDHGQGIFSLYSHMSEITVALESMVEKGAIIGRTGSTGMAGGDHLHCGMLVNGIFVSPVEWWDPHWLQDNIFRFL